MRPAPRDATELEPLPLDSPSQPADGGIEHADSAAAVPDSENLQSLDKAEG
jgi:hypothetical protein